MTDALEHTLPEAADERLDTLLGGWAAANALATDRVAAIRCRVLSGGEAAGTDLSVEWWQAFSKSISRSIEQSTLALCHALRAA